ncbi:hypothetical protein FA15DRAFT_129472 [Coprinopsis marcescibilis]|uniref:Uncharacterized protein n=1 Tax=Coprinopsis marcescibilis TaxID=230819 RepID=A0A5C3KK98_COPMA|nr:hypothetical protein FA15DRAFT_129472 [Coprinopsis marcescibilis]
MTPSLVLHSLSSYFSRYLFAMCAMLDPKGGDRTASYRRPGMLSHIAQQPRRKRKRSTKGSESPLSTSFALPRDPEENVVLTRWGQPQSKTQAVKRKRRPLSARQSVEEDADSTLHRNAGSAIPTSTASDGKSRVRITASLPDGTSAATTSHRVKQILQRLSSSGSTDQNIPPNVFLSQVRQSIKREKESKSGRKLFIMDVIMDLKANLAEGSAAITQTFLAANVVGETFGQQNWAYYRTYDFAEEPRALENYWADQAKIWRHDGNPAVPAGDSPNSSRPVGFPISVERSTASWSPALPNEAFGHDNVNSRT